MTGTQRVTHQLFVDASVTWPSIISRSTASERRLDLALSYSFSFSGFRLLSRGPCFQEWSRASVVKLWHPPGGYFTLWLVKTFMQFRTNGEDLLRILCQLSLNRLFVYSKPTWMRAELLIRDGESVPMTFSPGSSESAL